METLRGVAMLRKCVTESKPRVYVLAAFLVCSLYFADRDVISRPPHLQPAPRPSPPFSTLPLNRNPNKTFLSEVIFAHDITIIFVLFCLRYDLSVAPAALEFVM